jgi:Fe2+ transport system protein FeoA
MTINQAPLHKKLTITSSKDTELTDLESRLLHLGFVKGETIVVKKKAPIFKEPLLVEVRGRLVAMSSSEAELVSVEVLA